MDRTLADEALATLLQRGTQYGDSDSCLSRIASFWTTFKGINFSNQDVCDMMTLLKLA